MPDQHPRQLGTRQLAINPAFFQDIKEDREELLFIEGRMKYLLGNSALFGENLKEFCELTELFRDQLALHFALEEAYGYFEEALEVAPRLHRKSKTLRAQHADLFERAQGLCEEAYRKPPLENEALAERARELVRSFDEHESAEMELIQSALNEDVGCGD